MYPRMISAGDGVFTDLQELDVPWRSITGIIPALNYGYSAHSARKMVAPFVMDVADIPEDGIPDAVNPLDATQRAIIAGTLYHIFIDKWNRLWELYNLEYNPLNNYSLVENETIAVDGSGTVTNTGTQARVIDTDTTNTGTDTHAISKSETDGGTESIQKTGVKQNTGTDTKVTDTDTSNTGTVGDSAVSHQLDGIFGFNSSDSVGKDTTDGTYTNTRTDNLAGTLDTTETETQNLREDTTGTDTHTRSLTHSATNSDTETKNLASTVDTTDTRTDNLTKTSSEESESRRALAKSGNIGFNTPQEMIAADLELWQWNFFKSVFDDIDSLLTLSIY